MCLKSDECKGEKIWGVRVDSVASIPRHPLPVSCLHFPVCSVKRSDYVNSQYESKAEILMIYALESYLDSWGGKSPMYETNLGLAGASNESEPDTQVCGQIPVCTSWIPSPARCWSSLCAQQPFQELWMPSYHHGSDLQWPFTLYSQMQQGKFMQGAYDEINSPVTNRRIVPGICHII